jgi:hypothetical protein
MKADSWKSVDSQQDLEELDHYLWDHDKETVEFYGKLGQEKYFPADVSRRGYNDKNLHVLVKVGVPAPQPYLELVFIAYEYIGRDFIDKVHARGKIDSLKRITIEDDGVKCGRLIYRWVNEPTSRPYFLDSHSLGT